MKRVSLYMLFIAVAGALVGSAGDAQAIIGRPLTPMSYAGVARRTVRRTAYVGAAAAYGTAAAYRYAAPVPAMPVGCAPGVNCGGVTYQPAYQGPNVVYVPQ